MSDRTVPTSMGPIDSGSPFAPESEDSGVSPWRTKLDRIFDRSSEWLNPILVKESRQAFKSRQFVVTFTLLLICCWLWSVFVVAIRTPAIYYVPAGRVLLSGYYWILVFPLFVIIPFSAFRSLAGEREDGTYELLSISSLRPQQIVTGKMSSSMLQMLVYLSVLAPCMTFTYLLRGLDIATIIVIVFYAALSCWTLCCVGLMLATLTGPRHWQVFTSVFFILLLAVTFFTTAMTGTAMINQAPAVDLASWEFWAINGMITTALLAVGAMCLCAGTSKITPRSENRSTTLRVGMVFCHLLFFFWMLLVAVQDQSNSPELVIAFQIFATLGWTLFGGLMIGEDHLLSPRIRRGLPKTALGRVFLTLFYPGPGTGYLFAITNMMIMFVCCLVLAGYCGDSNRVENALAGAWILLCYYVIYLGIARLILRLLSRGASTGPVLGLLITIIVTGVTSLLTMIFQFTLSVTDYTLIQLPNAFWTWVEVVDSRNFSMSVPIALILSVAAFLVFVMNLFRMSAQLNMENVAAPERVQKEDAALKPKVEAKPTRTSPWDDDE